MDRPKLEELIGKTFTSVTGKKDGDEIDFIGPDKSYRLYHDQCCCEDVHIDDICGDLEDLVGVPIIVAKELKSEPNPTPEDEDIVWTFYRFRTIKGTVTVRFYANQNTYYGIDVYFDYYNQPPAKIPHKITYPSK